MAGTRGESECVQETGETELGDHGSARSTLPVARVAVHAATLAAALECLIALVASSIIGWALTIDPAGGPAPLRTLKASAGVVDLVGLALQASAYASVLLALTLLMAGGGVIRWRHARLDRPVTAGARGFVACWVAWVAVVVLRGGITLSATAAGFDPSLNTLLAQQLATVAIDIALVVGSVVLARLMASAPTGSDAYGLRPR